MEILTPPSVKNKSGRRGGIVRDPLRDHMEDLIYFWDLINIKSNRGRFT
jgi:hypothetical protein